MNRATIGVLKLSAVDGILQAEFDSLREAVTAAQAARLQLLTDQITTYTIGTGQTSTTVTKFSMTRLNDLISGMLAQMIIIENRISGAGVTIVRPAW